jgi:hypothetical protein
VCCEQGRTALHYAIEEDSPGCVHWLLQRDARVDIRDHVRTLRRVAIRPCRRAALPLGCHCHAAGLSCHGTPSGRRALTRARTQNNLAAPDLAVHHKRAEIAAELRTHEVRARARAMPRPPRC